MKITTKKINKALKDSNYCLYLVCEKGSAKVLRAERGNVCLLSGTKKLDDGMRFKDGRTGQEIHL